MLAELLFLEQIIHNLLKDELWSRTAENHEQLFLQLYSRYPLKYLQGKKRQQLSVRWLLCLLSLGRYLFVTDPLFACFYDTRFTVL